MQMREKVGKSRNIVFFQWFVAPEGRKVGSLKRRVRSQLARWELKNCTPLWREAHVQVERYKTPGSRSTFGSWDVEKVHAVVARSTFRSENAQNTSVSDHFWKLRCRKSACRCGAKHISKSKRTKHTIVRPLLEVEMSKKCTPLWREAHFEVKMYKTHQRRTTFGSWDVEKVHAVVARSTFRSQNVQDAPASDHFWKLSCRKSARRCGGSTFRSQNLKNTRGSDHFWRFRCRFASLWFTTLHYTLHYTTVHYTTLHSTTLQLQLHNYTPLHSTRLHYTPLLNYTTLLYTTLHYTTLHFTTLHYTTTTTTTTQLHSTTLHYTKWHYTTLHYTTLHSTTLHYTTLHYTTLHYTEWHCTTDRQVDR